MVTHINKSSQKIEAYNEAKLAKSITKSLISAHYTKNDATHITEQIIIGLLPWLTNRSQVTSLDIRMHVSSLLKKVDPHAALIYKKHKNLW